MNTLRAHERVHNISQPYVCGKCGESYEFACQLEYHTLQHGVYYTPEMSRGVQLQILKCVADVCKN
ncbi:hypothetical protein ANCDUO_15868 [Ancylostoma duodenale]|uniref:C2H2-type domain-containing protein n=1 Tax=Ancylostoma duodenale TaxID=51022 RepID=A0A0C2GAQ0_9BILA|nr:hypothetical protein ANCDUO_15868 [Ancylostoma duodenale]